MLTVLSRVGPVAFKATNGARRDRDHAADIKRRHGAGQDAAVSLTFARAF